MAEQMMQQGQGQPQAQSNLPKPNPEVMSPVVQAHLDELEQMRGMMDGKLGDAYDRVLTAGMKMLYSQQNAQIVTQLITDDQIPIPNKLGEGVGNLMVMMDNQGNGTIPKEVIIPVGVALMFEAADYLFECGIDVTEDDLGKGLEILLTSVMTGYGLDTAKMDQIIDDMGKRLGFEEEGGAEGETASEEVAEPTQPTPEQDEEAGFQQGFAQERGGM